MTPKEIGDRATARREIARELMAAIVEFSGGDDFVFIEDVEDAFDSVLDWRDEPVADDGEAVS